MGSIYGKNQTLYTGIDRVCTYSDSLIIKTYNGIRFDVLKSHANIEKISKIISQFQGTDRILEFTYDSTMFEDVLTYISVPKESKQNMKFTTKIDYMCDKNFDEFVHDSPKEIFIIRKDMSNDLIPGSTYEIKYLRYIRYNLITSYTQVGFGNEMSYILEHPTELELES